MFTYYVWQKKEKKKKKIKNTRKKIARKKKKKFCEIERKKILRKIMIKISEKNFARRLPTAGGQNTPPPLQLYPGNKKRAKTALKCTTLHNKKERLRRIPGNFRICT